ncbi:hypothetical protein C0Q70_04730 [Pomacea canaliculata]|uniref:Uncharacterized protein n=1 Tax=Pomacea canaliculata TaxID=400727 RepID=A0A2T7PJ80_POMCA|nr:hypothetical protein C0Q70_04730 [Pomacea canaliculata]
MTWQVLQTREAGNKGGRKMSHASLGSPKQLRSTIKRRFSMFSRERISTLLSPLWFDAYERQRKTD